MSRQNPAHHVLVDLDAESMRDLLGNPGTAEARIAVLHLEDHGNQFLRRTLGSGPTTRLTREQQTVFPLNQCSVKSQQRRGPDGDGDSQNATRTDEQRAQVRIPAMLTDYSART
jgi:hypothetical protein